MWQSEVGPDRGPLQPVTGLNVLTNPVFQQQQIALPTVFHDNQRVSVAMQSYAPSFHPAAPSPTSTGMRPSSVHSNSSAVLDGNVIARHTRDITLTKKNGMGFGFAIGKTRMGQPCFKTVDLGTCCAAIATKRPTIARSRTANLACVRACVCVCVCQHNVPSDPARIYFCMIVRAS